MEIMGLVVIVILLTLGMFFITSLRSQEPKSEIKKNFEQDQLAANFIVSFLKTNSDCKKYSIENMIQDCAVEKKLRCNNLDSCDYVNITSEIFLNKTMHHWQKRYMLEISGMKDPNDNIFFSKECAKTDERDSAFQPISLYPYPGTVMVQMDICE